MDSLIIEADDDGFEKAVDATDRPVLVDFWSPRCRPCHALAVELEKLAAEVGDRLRIVKINVDENPMTRAEYEIFHLPALGLFEKGEFVRFIGGIGKKDAIKAALGLDGT
jgi:thioredoxin 1